MKKSIFICSFLFLCFALCSFEKIETKMIEEENQELVQNYFTKNSNAKVAEEQYLGILEIPSISLERGFYSYSSENNTVEKNIQVISSTCTPNENCDFILASHSGTSNIAFFKNLYQLKESDTAYLYYQNKKYSYILKNIEHVEKDGTIEIISENNPRLILTTCNKVSDTLQDIYYFELLNIE